MLNLSFLKHFELWNLPRYQKLFLHVCSNMFCVTDFFITFNDVEILLLDVKNRYTVVPLKSGCISEKRMWPLCTLWSLPELFVMYLEGTFLHDRGYKWLQHRERQGELQEPCNCNTNKDFWSSDRKINFSCPSRWRDIAASSDLAWNSLMLAHAAHQHHL